MTTSQTPTDHTVTGRRIVPIGKGNLHEGQHAVCVRLSESGFIAWGFGATPEAAEFAAVAYAITFLSPDSSAAILPGTAK